MKSPLVCWHGVRCAAPWGHVVVTLGGSVYWIDTLMHVLVCLPARSLSLSSSIASFSRVISEPLGRAVGSASQSNGPSAEGLVVTELYDSGASYLQTHLTRACGFGRPVWEAFLDVCLRLRLVTFISLARPCFRSTFLKGKTGISNLAINRKKRTSGKSGDSAELKMSVKQCNIEEIYRNTRFKKKKSSFAVWPLVSDYNAHGNLWSNYKWWVNRQILARLLAKRFDFVQISIPVWHAHLSPHASHIYPIFITFWR